MKIAAWLILPLALCFFGTASAEFYKYTDPNGVVRFTDDISKVPVDQRPGVTSYEESDSTLPPPHTKAHGEVQPDATNKNPDTDAGGDDDQAQKIKKKQDALEKEFKALKEERSRLDAESKKATTARKTEEYNLKINELNKKLSQYDQNRKKLNAEIDAYNAEKQGK